MELHHPARLIPELILARVLSERLSLRREPSRAKGDGL